MTKESYTFYINLSIDYLNKGYSIMGLRSFLVENGVEDAFASQLAKNAFSIYIVNNSAIKIKRGLFWIGVSFVAVILSYYINKISGGTKVLIFIGAFVYGTFQFLSGYQNKKIAQRQYNDSFVDKG